MTSPLSYGPFISRAQAKAQGIGSYYIGTVCKHGHLDAHYVNGGCKTCCKLKKRVWRRNNPHESVRRVSEYQRKNKAVYNAKRLAAHKLRRETDMNFNMTLRLRRRLNGAMHSQGAVAAASTLELLGCTADKLKLHLASQFTDGMSFDNYGEWEIDHIRPCVSFDLTDPKQQKECFHFSNLQPLWKSDNARKCGRWEPMAA